MTPMSPTDPSWEPDMRQVLSHPRFASAHDSVRIMVDGSVPKERQIECVRHGRIAGVIRMQVITGIVRRTQPGRMQR